ncbi:MAG: hypothetical protein QOE61_5654 [Micromonosporaceae bacterium]|jgi:hypothetical protein|nr:hypothetical protein [Micromonosporaceae bacterium]
MALPHVPPRAVVAGLVVIAVIAVGFVAAALTNPWHLTGLYPLARKGGALGVLVLAGALLATAGLLRLSSDSSVPSQSTSSHDSSSHDSSSHDSSSHDSSSHSSGAGRRMVAAFIVSLVAIAILCVGLPVVAFDDSFRREDDGQVLAVSPDGGFSAVKSTSDRRDGPRTRIYIRSRAGLFSRESAIPAAECPFDPFARGVPPESVRFTSEKTLAVPLADKPTTVVAFDTESLAPQRTVMMCDVSG